MSEPSAKDEIRREMHDCFDAATTATLSVPHDPAPGAHALSGSVQDIDDAGGRTIQDHTDRPSTFLKAKDRRLGRQTGTDGTPDHPCGAASIQRGPRGQNGIGKEIGLLVRDASCTVFTEGAELLRDGSLFDALSVHGPACRKGTRLVKTIHATGKTPAPRTHVVGDAAVACDGRSRRTALRHGSIFPAATRPNFTTGSGSSRQTGCKGQR